MIGNKVQTSNRHTDRQKDSQLKSTTYQKEKTKQNSKETKKQRQTDGEEQPLK